MRTAYRVLAWLVAVEVVVQAAAISWGIFGLGKWVESGGVFDKAVLESDASAFPEDLGFAVHGINGQMVIPVLALALLVVSFFAKLTRGVALAGGVVGLVALQVLLGMLHQPVLGLLHGANALLLFGLAVTAAMRAGRLSREQAVAVASGRSGARI